MITDFGHTQIELGWHGVEGDRRFAFVRTSKLVGMPWLTASRVPELLLYKPHYADGDIVQGSVQVQTPDRLEMELSDARLAERISHLYGSDVHPMRLDSGIFDQAALSLISQETITAVSEETSRNLEVARFRPNIVWNFSMDNPLLKMHGSGDGLYLGLRSTHQLCASLNAIYVV